MKNEDNVFRKFRNILKYRVELVKNLRIGRRLLGIFEENVDFVEDLIGFREYMKILK